MTQHIRVVKGPDGDPVSDPPVGGVWRDDQTIIWGLSNEYSWDDSIAGGPIQFVTDESFSPWPGSMPSPIGPLEGTEDRRYYVALANKLNDGTTPIRYKYYMYVITRSTHDHVKVGPRTTFNAFLQKEETVDPVIDNHPEP